VTNRLLLTLFIAVFVWSLIHPHDYFTWFLEVFPAIIGIVLIIALRNRFPLTPLLLTLLTLHAIILMVGGHYTYAEVPLGFWMRDVFHLGRNDYDRIGHFAQGFVPAIAAREILIRRNVVRGRGWLYFIIVAICLAISAAYELLEWRVSVATAAPATPSSARRATCGTRRRIWLRLWWGRFWRRRYWGGCTIGSFHDWRPVPDPAEVGEEPEHQHHHAHQPVEVARVNAGDEVAEPRRGDEADRQQQLDESVDAEADDLDDAERIARHHRQREEHRGEEIAPRCLLAVEPGDRRPGGEQDGEGVVDAAVRDRSDAAMNHGRSRPSP